MNSLIKEAIHINGINLVYIPRQAVAVDKIYGEDVLSSFTKSFDMVMYVESTESFGSTGAFLGMQGLDLNEKVTLIVSKDVFTEVVAESADNDTNLLRPNEGDLIYAPLMNKVFEIMDIEEYQLFYQLGKQYTYKLNCELWDYSNETVETGLPEIDNKNLEDIVRSYEITLKTSGTPAYQVAESVYIGPNLALADFSGTVTSYNPLTKKIVVESVHGVPENNVILNGETSSAVMEVQEFVQINFHDSNKDNEQLIVEKTPIIVRDPKDDSYGY